MRGIDDLGGTIQVDYTKTDKTESIIDQDGNETLKTYYNITIYGYFKDGTTLSIAAESKDNTSLVGWYLEGSDNKAESSASGFTTISIKDTGVYLAYGETSLSSLISIGINVFDSTSLIMSEDANHEIINGLATSMKENPLNGNSGILVYYGSNGVRYVNGSPVTDKNNSFLIKENSLTLKEKPVAANKVDYSYTNFEFNSDAVLTLTAPKYIYHTTPVLDEDNPEIVLYSYHDTYMFVGWYAVSSELSFKRFSFNLTATVPQDALETGNIQAVYAPMGKVDLESSTMVSEQIKEEIGEENANIISSSIGGYTILSNVSGRLDGVNGTYSINQLPYYDTEKNMIAPSITVSLEARPAPGYYLYGWRISSPAGPSVVQIIDKINNSNSISISYSHTYRRFMLPNSNFSSFVPVAIFAKLTEANAGISVYDGTVSDTLESTATASLNSSNEITTLSHSGATITITKNTKAFHSMGADDDALDFTYGGGYGKVLSLKIELETNRKFLGWFINGELISSETEIELNKQITEEIFIEAKISSGNIKVSGTSDNKYENGVIVETQIKNVTETEYVSGFNANLITQTTFKTKGAADVVKTTYNPFNFIDLSGIVSIDDSLTITGYTMNNNYKFIGYIEKGKEDAEILDSISVNTSNLAKVKGKTYYALFEEQSINKGAYNFTIIKTIENRQSTSQDIDLVVKHTLTAGEDANTVISYNTSEMTMKTAGKELSYTLSGRAAANMSVKANTLLSFSVVSRAANTTFLGWFINGKYVSSSTTLTPASTTDYFITQDGMVVEAKFIPQPAQNTSSILNGKIIAYDDTNGKFINPQLYVLTKQFGAYQLESGTGEVIFNAYATNNTNTLLLIAGAQENYMFKGFYYNNGTDLVKLETTASAPSGSNLMENEQLITIKELEVAMETHRLIEGGDIPFIYALYGEEATVEVNLITNGVKGQFPMGFVSSSLYGKTSTTSGRNTINLNVGSENYTTRIECLHDGLKAQPDAIYNGTKNISYNFTATTDDKTVINIYFTEKEEKEIFIGKMIYSNLALSEDLTYFTPLNVTGLVEITAEATTTAPDGETLEFIGWKEYTKQGLQDKFISYDRTLTFTTTNDFKDKYFVKVYDEKGNNNITHNGEHYVFYTLNGLNATPTTQAKIEVVKQENQYLAKLSLDNLNVAGWGFKGWYKNGILLSTDANFTYKIDGTNRQEIEARLTNAIKATITEKDGNGKVELISDQAKVYNGNVPLDGNLYLSVIAPEGKKIKSIKITDNNGKVTEPTITASPSYFTKIASSVLSTITSLNIEITYVTVLNTEAEQRIINVTNGSLFTSKLPAIPEEQYNSYTHNLSVNGTEDYVINLNAYSFDVTISSSTTASGVQLYYVIYNPVTGQVIRSNEYNKTYNNLDRDSLIILGTYYNEERYTLNGWTLTTFDNQTQTELDPVTYPTDNKIAPPSAIAVSLANQSSSRVSINLNVVSNSPYVVTEGIITTVNSLDTDETAGGYYYFDEEKGVIYVQALPGYSIIDISATDIHGEAYNLGAYTSADQTEDKLRVYNSALTANITLHISFQKEITIEVFVKNNNKFTSNAFGEALGKKGIPIRSNLKANCSRN